MKYYLNQALMKLWTLSFILPVFGLSACSATVPAILSAPPCFTEMVTAAGLDKHVPHAPVPAEPTAGAWVAGMNQEGGQLDIANSRNDAVVGIGKTCDRWAQEAKKQIEHKPWYRRVF